MSCLAALALPWKTRQNNANKLMEWHAWNLSSCPNFVLLVAIIKRTVKPFWQRIDHSHIVTHNIHSHVSCLSPARVRNICSLRFHQAHLLVIYFAYLLFGAQNSVQSCFAENICNKVVEWTKNISGKHQNNELKEKCLNCHQVIILCGFLTTLTFHKVIRPIINIKIFNLSNFNDLVILCI